MKSKQSVPDLSIVRFDANEINSIKIGEDIYFVWTNGFEKAMVLAKCAHRGGPIHLAKICFNSKSLICPWHGARVTTQALNRQALPMCWREHEMTVVLCSSNEVSLNWLPITHDVFEKTIRIKINET
jgi:nitrite reductase/ring-hydroxylating ferredoxin subunit